jgi:hypothetical protein
MEHPFHRFGSQSSVDHDVVIFVPALGTIRENLALCEAHACLLNTFFSQKGLPSKKINMNAAVIAGGVIRQVYKGTPDELNNAVLRTYPLHTQFYPLLIDRAEERNWQLKMIRACRTILSFYTHTPLRPVIKQALQGDLDAKINALHVLNLTDWPEPNGATPHDCWKTVAFQLGQAMGLLEGMELYTKEETEAAFPELGVFLHRRAAAPDLRILEATKQAFVAKLQLARPRFSKLTEQEWTQTD